MITLATTYLGLHLKSPLVPSASPLTGDFDNVRRLEDAGAAAIVLPSLFEEQLRHQFNDPSWFISHGIEPYPPELSYLPNEADFLATPEQHLERINRASRDLSIPVIASLSGCSPGRWTQFARQMEDAGADAIELSLYNVPTDFETDSLRVEELLLQIVADVRREVKVPIAVKLSPFFTCFPNMARRIVEFGADGLVLFNRLFNADVELEHGDMVRSVRWTTSADVELPFRWISLLKGHLKTSLAGTSGVHTGTDALKLIFAGADVAMLCSSLLIHGIGHLETIESEMLQWLEAKGHISLDYVRGSAAMDHWPKPSTLQRANYIWAIGGIAKRQQAMNSP